VNVVLLLLLLWSLPLLVAPPPLAAAAMRLLLAPLSGARANPPPIEASFVRPMIPEPPHLFAWACALAAAFRLRRLQTQIAAASSSTPTHAATTTTAIFQAGQPPVPPLLLMPGQKYPGGRGSPGLAGIMHTLVPEIPAAVIDPTQTPLLLLLPLPLLLPPLLADCCSILRPSEPTAALAGMMVISRYSACMGRWPVKTKQCSQWQDQA
jgi:hypothetical protein